MGGDGGHGPGRIAAGRVAQLDRREGRSAGVGAYRGDRNPAKMADHRAAAAAREVREKLEKGLINTQDGQLKKKRPGSLFFNRRAHKFFRGGMAFLADAFALDHFPQGQEQDLQVQPEGPVIHVPDIQAELFFPGQGVAAVDLRPAGDAGLDLVTAGLVGRVAFQIDWIRSGRGPTRLIWPRSTLNSSGSSSRLVERRKRPSAVSRLASGRGLPWRSKALRMVRNL